MNININKRPLRIIVPYLLKNKKKWLLFPAILVLALVLLNIFLNHKKQKPLFIKKDNTTFFLENLMIREDGLFTLLGSKPITQFDITGKISETEEEFQREYEELKAIREQHKHDPTYVYSKIKLPEYEEFKKERLKDLPRMHFAFHKKIWERWLAEKGCLSNSVYKLTFRDSNGLFINVPNTIYILKKHYADFVEITGLPFDVDTILDSIDDQGSIFWQKVFTNRYLCGLILGYGQKNAFLFDWVRRNSLSLDSISLKRFHELSRFRHHAKLMLKANITVEDLEIPYFVTFDIDNEDVERYSREREKIVDFLKDKDLVAFVLDQLK